MSAQVRAENRARMVEAPALAKCFFFITSFTYYRANFGEESSQKGRNFSCYYAGSSKVRQTKVNCARVNCGIHARLAQETIGDALRQERAR